MVCRASYKIGWKKSERGGRAAESTDKCTVAELSTRASPALAGLPFSPAPHTDAQARLTKQAKTLRPSNAEA